MAIARDATYAQYENSDCLMPSHHAVLAAGDISRRLDVVGQSLGVAMERV